MDIFDEELTFELIKDPNLYKILREPLFNDFVLVIGKDQTPFSINLNYYSLFSSRLRELYRQKKNENNLVESVSYPQLFPGDFKYYYDLMTRGNVKINPKNIVGILKMATFFDMKVLLDFLIDFVERNSDYIDRLDMFLFSIESKSKYLSELACKRVTELGEVPFLSDKLAHYFSEESLAILLSRLQS